MKTKNLKFIVLALGIALTVSSCKKDSSTTTPTTATSTSIVPSTFRIDIPTSLSETTATKGLKADAIGGNAIYGNLRTFIGVGDASAKIVQSIMDFIATQKINKPLSYTFTSKDDNRVKTLEVVQNPSVFEGVNYQYQLTITDVASATDVDGGKAIQILWNTNPVKGVAILKALNIDKVKNSNFADCLIRIDYSEDKTATGNDQDMIVSIVKWPSATTDTFALGNLKLHVERLGDIVKVCGNSTHPKAKFGGNTTTGFEWVFVAASDRSTNIAISNVGLPSLTETATDNVTIFDKNSIKNILTRECIAGVKIKHPELAQLNDTTIAPYVAPYLANATSPGFFKDGAFTSAGTNPDTRYDALKTIMNTLTPYKPSDINTLSLSFKLN